MKLSIDTSDSKKTIVGLNDKIFEYKTKDFKSQKLLELIDEALKKENIKLTDLSEIEVNLGPGSFTGLRIGVSTANALAWALKIPINGQEKDQLVMPLYEENIKT